MSLQSIRKGAFTDNVLLGSCIEPNYTLNNEACGFFIMPSKNICGISLF